MQAWDSFPYERLSLRVHLRHCGLVAGDIVTLSSDLLYGVDEPANWTYDRRNCMVVGSSFDFASRSCMLDLAMLPYFTKSLFG